MQMLSPSRQTPFIALHLVSLTIPFGGAGLAADSAAETAYTQAIEKRATDILSVLDLSDAAKKASVHDLLIAQYRALREWHDVNDAKLKKATDEEARQIRAS